MAQFDSDALNLLKTPLWIVAPKTQEILFANLRACELSAEPGLENLRHGRFSVHAHFRLEAYLPSLRKKEAIVEIWTVQEDSVQRPMACRLSLGEAADGEATIIVAGMADAGHSACDPAMEQTPPCGREEGCLGHAFYEQLFRTASVPMLLIDPSQEGRIVDANQAAIMFYGHTLEEMRARHTWNINVMGRDVLPVMQEIAKLPGGHKPLGFRHRLADGSIRHVQTYAGPVTLEGRRLMLGIIHDITEQKRLEQELQKAALQDPLTGLWNRRQFMNLVHSAHTQFERYGQVYSLLLIDVDHFKRINDRYGHDRGDEVLILIAKALESRVRESDAVCRWGGEEFVVLLPHTHREGAMQMAESLRQTIECLSRPGVPPLSVSIGVVQGAKNEDSTSLFKRVDEALYRAKSAGRNQIESG